jgi:Mn2+/Fe2+ NRAMP family transporter
LPYLFFWQALQEVEEEKEQGRRTLAQRRGASPHELRDAALDVNTGMFFSNVIMYFIILATASTLYRSGARDIPTARQAAEALRPLAGEAAYLLFALGLIGTGFLASRCWRDRHPSRSRRCSAGGRGSTSRRAGAVASISSSPAPSSAA